MPDAALEQGIQRVGGFLRELSSLPLPHGRGSEGSRIPSRDRKVRERLAADSIAAILGDRALPQQTRKQRPKFVHRQKPEDRQVSGHGQPLRRHERVKQNDV